MSVHNTERQYKCGECGKLFKRISHVREHFKIHSGDRPFPCSVCSKAFKSAVSCYYFAINFGEIAHSPYLLQGQLINISMDCDI